MPEMNIYVSNEINFVINFNIWCSDVYGLPMQSFKLSCTELFFFYCIVKPNFSLSIHTSMWP